MAEALGLEGPASATPSLSSRSDAKIGSAADLEV